MKLIKRNCSACNSKDYTVLYKENFDFEVLNDFAFASRKIPEYMHYELAECNHCSLLFASTAPDINFISESYVEADYDSSTESIEAAETYFKYFRKKLSNKNITNALDIGCGDGSFLHRLYKFGIKNIKGFEPSLKARDKANKDIIDCIIPEIFDAKTISEKYDLISLFMIIEHVYNPAEFLKNIYDALENDGSIFIVCHDRKSLLAKLMGRKSPIFDIEHLQLFCPESVRNLLEKIGFKEINTFKIVNSYNISYWVKLLPIPKMIKSCLLRFCNFTHLNKIKLPFPVGNMGVIASKGK